MDQHTAGLCLPQDLKAFSKAFNDPLSVARECLYQAWFTYGERAEDYRPSPKESLVDWWLHSSAVKL